MWLTCYFACLYTELFVYYRVVSCTLKKYTPSLSNASLMRLEVRFVSPLSSPCRLVLISLIKLQFVLPKRDYISTTESQMTGWWVWHSIRNNVVCFTEYPFMQVIKFKVTQKIKFYHPHVVSNLFLKCLFFSIQWMSVDSTVLELFFDFYFYSTKDRKTYRFGTKWGG